MKRLVFISLSLLLLVLIPSCITVQTPAPNPIPSVGTPSVVNSVPPSTPAPFAVTDIIANTEPSTFTGSCPKTFTFDASITANGPGTVTYRWESTDGESSDIQSITFDEAGTKTTTLKWDLVGSATGHHRIHVLNPNNVASNPIYYTLNCDGSPSTTLGTGITVGVVPGESGAIVKSGMDYTKSHSVCVGDTNGSMASRAFLSFDISSIPSNALIDDVAMKIGGFTTTGNPTYSDPINGPQYGNFGALEIYRYQYGTYENLDTFAYNRPGELVASGEITNYPLSPWNLQIKDPVSGKLSVQGLVIAGQPRFQLRTQFFTSTNWDGVADMLCFDQALLTVKYHLP